MLGCGEGKGKCRERCGEEGDVGKCVGVPHPDTFP